MDGGSIKASAGADTDSSIHLLKSKRNYNRCNASFLWGHRPRGGRITPWCAAKWIQPQKTVRPHAAKMCDNRRCWRWERRCPRSRHPVSTTIARPWHRAIDRLQQATGSCRGLRGLQKLTVSARCAGRRSSADERRSPRRCDHIPIPGR